MPATFDSIYPDFLRSGLGKMHTLGLGQELSGLFTALEHFRRDMHEQDSATGILKVTDHYIAGLHLFARQAFYLVNPEDFSFGLELCTPKEDHLAGNAHRMKNAPCTDIFRIDVYQHG